VSSRSSSNSYSPPKFTGFYNVGWIKSAHGIRGELFLRLHAERADWADEAHEIAILPNGKSELQTFSIEKMSAHKDGWILKLEGVRDRNRAEELAKSAVYIDENLLEENEPGEAIYLKQILDFDVLDPKGVVLGRIRGFASNGPQDLLRVETANGREALVPLIDAFLVHIDFDKKQVTMDLPPGLIDDEE
jgi:16S rRNA processing protein RimM